MTFRTQDALCQNTNEAVLQLNWVRTTPATLRHIPVASVYTSKPGTQEIAGARRNCQHTAMQPELCTLVKTLPKPLQKVSPSSSCHDSPLLTNQSMLAKLARGSLVPCYFHMSYARSSVDQVLPASLPQLREVSQEDAQCSHSAVPGMGGEKVRHNFIIHKSSQSDHAHKQNLTAELAASCKAHHAFLAKPSLLKCQHH